MHGNSIYSTVLISEIENEVKRQKLRLLVSLLYCAFDVTAMSSHYCACTEHYTFSNDLMMYIECHCHDVLVISVCFLRMHFSFLVTFVHTSDTCLVYSHCIIGL